MSIRRRYLLIPLAGAMLLAACGGGEGDEQANAQPPAPRPTGPAPRTPVLDVPTVAGNQADWMGATDGARDPRTAPYGNMLDQPLVNAR